MRCAYFTYFTEVRVMPGALSPKLKRFIILSQLEYTTQISKFYNDPYISLLTL
jgi:hypothetical protein